MVQERNFREYLEALKELLSEHFEGKFYFVPSTDSVAAKELFELKLAPEEVLSFLVKYGEDLISRRFNLFQVKELVKNFSRRPSESSEVPYSVNRVEILIDFLDSLSRELKLDQSLLKRRLEELLEEEDSFKVERELYRIEDELFNMLEETPAGRKCREEAERKVDRFSFYWKGKVLEVTRKALVRECLRKRYGIPEFTSLNTP